MITMSVAPSSLPFWDGWTQVTVLANDESPFSPAWMWRQHNEHRLPIQKLFLAADLRLFHTRHTLIKAIDRILSKVVLFNS